MPKNNRVQSVVKASKIFEELVYYRDAVSLSQLSQTVGLNISTVHRLLNTLLDRGYVEKNSDGLYCLGRYAYELADLINQGFDLRAIVHPFLEEIVDACNETCNLVVLEDNQVVYLDQVESSNMVRMFASIGSRGPAYCTGAGKMLLSYLDGPALTEYLNTSRFVPFTENTITDPLLFRQELRRIKSRGFSLDREEREKGVCCVAVPILGKEERVLGAISVSGPSARLTSDYLNEELIPLLKSKAEDLGRKL